MLFRGLCLVFILLKYFTDFSLSFITNIPLSLLFSFESVCSVILVLLLGNSLTP